MCASLKYLMAIVLGVSLITDAYGQQSKVERLRLQYSLEKQIKAGDFEGVKKLRSYESLPLLYNLLRLEDTHQFHEQGPALRAILIANISAIPGHAKYLGDNIDKNSNEPFTGGSRGTDFSLLTSVASPEAVAELGRFLFDDRNPDKAIKDKFPDDDGGGFYLFPNSETAANCLGIVLGDKSPVKDLRPGNYGTTEVRQMQQWWNSPEGLAFRSVSPVVAPPKTPPLPIAEAPTPETPMKEVKQAPKVWPWLAGIFCGAVLAILVWRRQAQRK